MMLIPSEIMGLVKLILEWIQSGASAEQIMARLRDPNGTGMELLDRLVKRRAAGGAYLGRAPQVRVVDSAPISVRFRSEGNE